MIDLTKKYTCNGFKVLQITHFPEAFADARLVVLIDDALSGKPIKLFYEDGTSTNSDYNLVMVKEEVSRWLVEWENGFSRNIFGDYSPYFFSDVAANEFAEKHGGIVHEVKIKI